MERLLSRWSTNTRNKQHPKKNYGVKAQTTTCPNMQSCTTLSTTLNTRHDVIHMKIVHLLTDTNKAGDAISLWESFPVQVWWFGHRLDARQLERLFKTEEEFHTWQRRLRKLKQTWMPPWHIVSMVVWKVVRSCIIYHPLHELSLSFGCKGTVGPLWARHLQVLCRSNPTEASLLSVPQITAHLEPIRLYYSLCRAAVLSGSTCAPTDCQNTKSHSLPLVFVRLLLLCGFDDSTGSTHWSHNALKSVSQYALWRCWPAGQLRERFMFFGP